MCHLCRWLRCSIRAHATGPAPSSPPSLCEQEQLEEMRADASLYDKMAASIAPNVSRVSVVIGAVVCAAVVQGRFLALPVRRLLPSWNFCL